MTHSSAPPDALARANAALCPDSAFDDLPWQAQALVVAFPLYCDDEGRINLNERGLCEHMRHSLPGWPKRVIDVGITALLLSGGLDTSAGQVTIAQHLIEC